MEVTNEDGMTKYESMNAKEKCKFCTSWHRSKCYLWRLLKISDYTYTRHMGMKPFPTLLCDLERLTLYSQPQLSHMKNEGFGFTKL